MSSLHYDGPQNVLCNRPVVARSARAGADTRTPGSLLPVTRARERRHQGDEVVRCRHHHIAEIRRLERRDSKHPLSLALPLSLIHISEPTRLGMISYAVFCLKKKK